VERTLREECGVQGETIVVAVSGGGDSIALLDVLGRLARRLRLRLVAHGVDHGLRPEAAEELRWAEALAQEHQVPFGSSRVHVALGGNLQSRAREARYAALTAAAEQAGARWVATGHHADDRAETVLMRIMRGAGPRGLAVLGPAEGGRLRPLIRARRSDVVAHLERHALKYASDPSNQDRRFLRSRVRHELLPLLESLEPQSVRHLNALADQLMEGDAPIVLDAAGKAVVLSRAQAAALRRAQKFRLFRARIRLAGGREIQLDRRTGRPVIVEAFRWKASGSHE
jgi:tRNA(Ile)-lysidine synthase